MSESHRSQFCGLELHVLDQGEDLEGRVFLLGGGERRHIALLARVVQCLGI